jgi:hypothetical protein
MAIQVRLGEKEILQDLSIKLSAYLADADGSNSGSAKRTASGFADDLRRAKAPRT